jgi:hypothetical protein
VLVGSTSHMEGLSTYLYLPWSLQLRIWKDKKKKTKEPREKLQQKVLRQETGKKLLDNRKLSFMFYCFHGKATRLDSDG